MSSPLYLYNSYTRKKENFKPINAPHVGLYVCGPTVYGDPHLGHARPYIVFDVLNRLLVHLGYKVRYVRNITDVGHLENDSDEGEDKIAKKARLEEIEPMEVVQHYTAKFHEAMKALNNLPPNIEPSASGHIIEQISMIESIFKNGFAYEVNGSVYFDVNKYNEKHPYGKLSGRVLDEMMHNSRALDGQDEKRNPVDFALWKKAKPEHIMRWPSPWSDGFPGWHLECSAMSTRYLGETFDIHGGGLDLAFPHHENEIAQSCCLGGQESFAQIWIHNEMLQVDGKKMSKSLGNFFTVRDLLDQGYAGEVIRFVFLSTHYSKPMDWNASKALEATSILRKWHGLIKNNSDIIPVPEEVVKKLSDDLNTAGVISLLHNYASNGEIGKLKAAANFLGLLTEEMSEWFADVDMSSLENLFIDFRNRAIESKNFKNVDELRSKLTGAGVDVQIGKSNVLIVPNARFDRQKLDEIKIYYDLN